MREPPSAWEGGLRPWKRGTHGRARCLPHLLAGRRALGDRQG